EELRKKYGGVIRTEQRFMNLTPFTEVTSVKKGPIPEEILKLPEGYEKLERMPMHPRLR
ncbi:MAG: hypothetical protein GXO03_02275, partial [Aquificae bacterium]|nr:hypothetical protein [Aquificota bacterium]